MIYSRKNNIAIIHFYLCGNRQYWIHFLGGGWSYITYKGCRPLGNSSLNDAICLARGFKYRVRLKMRNRVMRLLDAIQWIFLIQLLLQE